MKMTIHWPKGILDAEITKMNLQRKALSRKNSEFWSLEAFTKHLCSLNHPQIVIRKEFNKMGYICIQ